MSCPSCGRAQVDVYTLADEVTAGLEGLEVPLRVAVMGCVVNGPGEAREADLGVASGNGKGQIFVRGEVVKTVPEKDIVETLIEEAMRIAEAMERDGAAVEAGSPARHRRLTPGGSPQLVVVRRALQLGRPAVDRAFVRVVGLQAPRHRPGRESPVQREQPPEHRHQHDIEPVQDSDDEEDPPSRTTSHCSWRAVTSPTKDRQSSGGSKCTVKRMYAVKIR